MGFFSEHKTLLITVVAIILVIGVWYGISSDAPSSSLLTSENVGGAGSAEDQNLVETLLQLRAVSLSGAILGDPAFLSLQDFGTQIVPEPIGRPNPFAPLLRGLQSTSTSRGSQLFPTR
ncbi:MAG: hypothetical protein HYS26_01535 [Candidatus Kaiserbacteria bacterium]|nr:MAG: hypothetical protein HYS26_01535 [Candidatus Kaiserbacteria bacterium]